MRDKIVEKIYEKKSLFLNVIGVSFDNITLDEKEEIFQDAILKFLSSKVKFENVSAGLYYFRKVFMNLILDENRKRIKRFFVEMVKEGEDFSAEDFFKESSNPHETLLRRDMELKRERILDEISKTLNSLPDEQKKYIFEYFLSKTPSTINQIARKYSVNPSKVYRDIQKGLLNMKKRIYPLLFVFILFIFILEI